MARITLITLPAEGQFQNWTTHPSLTPKVVKYLPLGSLSLASNIPPEHEVAIMDASSYDWGVQGTVDRILDTEPDILGITAVTRRVWALREILRECNHIQHVWVGGPHATFYGYDLLRWGADAVFIGGLADKEFAEAVALMVSGGTPQGIIQCRTNINDIAYPCRELLNVEDYFFKGKILFEAKQRLPMFSSSGCPNKCRFCNIDHSKPQYKEPSSVVDEIEYLKGLGAGSVHILDDNFNVKRSHVLGILEELEKRHWNTEWSARGQVKTDLSLYKRLAATGLKRVHIGFESFSDKTLGWFGKTHRLVDILAFCEEMQTCGIDILGYFITGAPTETDKDRELLPQLIRNCGIKYPFFNTLYPEPDTAYYRSLLKDGHYERDFWGEFMVSPVRNYQIPYPYGHAKKESIMSYNDALVDMFKEQ